MISADQSSSVLSPMANATVDGYHRLSKITTVHYDHSSSLLVVGRDGAYLHQNML